MPSRLVVSADRYARSAALVTGGTALGVVASVVTGNQAGATIEIVVVAGVGAVLAAVLDRARP